MTAVLSDYEIQRYCEKEKMISPFFPNMIKQKDGAPCLGFGLDSAGYDLRLADGVRVFSYGGGGHLVIDPKNFDERLLTTLHADKNGKIILPPMTTGLGKAMEHIKMPNNIVAIAGTKSTYARCGILLNFTKFVPGWEGDLVIEISNVSPFPATLYVEEGIMSVVFLRVNNPDALYSARDGGYQGQQGVTLPKA